MDNKNPFSAPTMNTNNTNLAVDTTAEEAVPKTTGKTIANGRKKPNTPATAEQVAKIYEMYGNGVATKQIADDLGLTPQQVNRKLSDARKAAAAQKEVATDPIHIAKIDAFIDKIKTRERTGTGGGSRENAVDTVLQDLGILGV